MLTRLAALPLCACTLLLASGNRAPAPAPAPQAGVGDGALTLPAGFWNLQPSPSGTFGSSVATLEGRTGIDLFQMNGVLGPAHNLIPPQIFGPVFGSYFVGTLEELPPVTMMGAPIAMGTGTPAATIWGEWRLDAETGQGTLSADLYPPEITPWEILTGIPVEPIGSIEGNFSYSQEAIGTQELSTDLMVRWNLD